LELGMDAEVRKARMMGLPDGRESFKISLSLGFQTQFRGATDSQTRDVSNDRAYA